MKQLDYYRATSSQDAVGQSLVETNDLKVKLVGNFLAGGTNLVDLMKFGVAHVDKVIDINHTELNKVEVLKNGGVRIGATVRNSDLAEHPQIKTHYTALSMALVSGASPQLRNMATTGGNLLQRTRCAYFYDTGFPCNKREPGSGCPAIKGFNRMHAILGGSDSCIATHPSDMAVAMALYGAVIHLRSTDGERSIPISELHTLPGDTPNIDNSLKLGELITGVELPPVEGQSTYIKLRDRASYAFALVSVAARAYVEQGKIMSAALALGGVAPKPWRVPDAERLMVGETPSPELFGKAADVMLDGAKGYGHNDFKIEAAKRIIVRALTEVTGGKA